MALGGSIDVFKYKISRGPSWLVFHNRLASFLSKNDDGLQKMFVVNYVTKHKFILIYALYAFFII